MLETKASFAAAAAPLELPLLEAPELLVLPELPELPLDDPLELAPLLPLPMDTPPPPHAARMEEKRTTAKPRAII